MHPDAVLDYKQSDWITSQIIRIWLSLSKFPVDVQKLHDALQNDTLNDRLNGRMTDTSVNPMQGVQKDGVSSMK